MSHARSLSRGLLLSLWSCLLTLTTAAHFPAPEVHPSPRTAGLGGWSAALDQASDFVAQLTMDEKVNMVTGAIGPCVGNIAPISRLGFNGLCLQDGPLAVRQATYASVFPAGLSAAASWDRDLIYQRGVAMGEEFRGKGAHVALGPVAGPLGRHALGGRNWEGFSPDPYLTGEAAQLTLSGLQNTGVQACIKHYIGNEQESQRNPTTENGVRIESVSSNIDDRTLHELYLWPFAEAVKANVSAVMCSYNRLNQTYACQNSKSLNGILKGELGFQGYVTSDWEATHSGVLSITSGLDMDMPGDDKFFGSNIPTAIKNGSFPEDRLDDMIRRIMIPYYVLGQNRSYPLVDPSEAVIEGNPPSKFQFPFKLNNTANVDVRSNHYALIRELGGASAVLLKNTKSVLPLKDPKVISVFGNDAADMTDGLYEPQAIPTTPWGYNIGTLPVGGGSGSGRLSYVVSPLEAIKARARDSGALVQYITDNAVASVSVSSMVIPHPDVCLVFLKTYVQEAQDRLSFDVDWNGTTVVNTVASSCNNTVVVTHSGGINTMDWADHPNVTAIIAAHLPGSETGNAIVDVLWGYLNPSGKLPYTIPMQASDYNAPITNDTGTNDPNGWQSDFTEGLLTDYRHFDAAKIKPRYEFGYGLSYTAYNISNLVILKLPNPDSNLTAFPPPPPGGQTPPGGNPALFDNVMTATVSVTNTGKMAGATVPQLYISLPQSKVPSGTPVQVLRGFDKIQLQPNQTLPITFGVTRKDVSFWDVEAQGWRVPEGEIGVAVGESSRDIRVKGSVSFL